MKLLVLGGSGKIGREIIGQALERGFDVTTLVRSPGKIPFRNERLQIVEGSPLDQKLLTQVVSGKDAVMSVLGHTDLKESSIVTDAARALIAVMHANNVTRLLIISSTLVTPGGALITRIPRLITRHAINDSASMEKMVMASSLAWTVFRLVRLSDKPKTSYRLAENEPPSVSPSVSRKTVAAGMLDLVSSEQYFRKAIDISGT